MSANAPKGEPNPPGSSRQSAGKFPRSVRLLRHADFERVYQQGKRHFSPHMTMFYLRRDQGEGFRVGFTVGRVLGGAVQRNRIRRRLREAVRLRLPVNLVPADIVINPKKSVLRAEFVDLLAEVERGFDVIQQKLASNAHT